MRKIQLACLTCLILASCAKEELYSDGAEHHFFLNNDKAIMPVQIKGNTNSKVFIITLHGGPGDSGIRDFGDNGIFRDLESDYAVVYWDQRCAGLSQGNCDPRKLQVGDFVDDIDKLILVLEDVYGNDLSLLLLGHSWGATLGLDYLINGANKNKIRGYVHSNGSHNIPMLFEEQKEIMMFYANQQIALGNHVNDWQAILDEISNADPSLKKDRIKILTKTYETEELFISLDSVSRPTLRVSLGSYLSGIFPALVNSNANDDFTLELFEYDISGRLSEITNPLALYWGKFDMVHPPKMAMDIYANVGSAEKELIFFSRSFHSPMANENELFQLRVKEFVEKHR